MCGRYALYGPISRVHRQFDVEAHEFRIGIDEPRSLPWNPYNVAPTQSPLVVRAGESGRRELIAARWGLRPSWIKEPGKFAEPINAKIETVSQKPMFRHAFKASRVLVPANGFYEWKPTPNGKQPYFIHAAAEGEMLGLAGLLEFWTGPDGLLRSFTILTTAANEVMTPIHDRMPVIIRPEDYAAWLDPALTDPDLARELARHYPPDALSMHPVSRAVGRSSASDAGLIEPIDL